MAIVHTVSVKVVDYLGDPKTIPLHTPSTVSLATLETVLDTTLNALDDAIDGQITEVVVSFQIDLPAGLKSSPVAGKDVHNGANLTYDPQDTNYAYSLYIPTWEEAGFAGQDVLTTGVYDTLEDILITDNWTDENGNTLLAFSGGKRTRRK